MKRLANRVGGLAAVALAATVAADERSVDAEDHSIRAETIAEELEHPWGLALLPDGGFLVTERNPGQLRVGSADGELSEPVSGVPEVFRFKGDTARSQGGLFDVKLHPDFQDNQQIYLSLSKPSEHGTGTAIVRGRLTESEDGHALEETETVFEMKEADQDSSGLHFGGRMALHPEDGSLFLSIGERRNISRAQDGGDQAGSIIRVDEQGAPHDDNPFLDDEEDNDDSIHSIGHRNPQAMGFEPDTGALWVADHGPLGGDEIERVEAGKNYGWPYITGGTDYSGAPIGVGTQRSGMESPVHIFEETVAPSGLAFYEGNLFEAWRGNMLVGGLAAEALVRLKVADDEIADVERIELDRRIRDVQVADDGAIWVITDHEDGEVMRLTPAE